MCLSPRSSLAHHHSHANLLSVISRLVSSFLYDYRLQVGNQIEKNIYMATFKIKYVSEQSHLTDAHFLILQVSRRGKKVESFFSSDSKR